MSLFNWLQNWYKNSCCKEEENLYGIRIYNVDNPGWAVEIDLKGTNVADKYFKKIQYDNGDEDWLLCFVRNGIFQGNGDGKKLNKIIYIFKEWVEE